MAKLPALITALAKVDGRERPTIDHIARVIREAGYIPTTKRGGGAAEMTAREAANLLIALNGADVPKDGPLAIDRFRSLRQFATIGRGTPGSTQLANYENYPKPIKDVMDARTFGDALEALIEGVPDLVMSFYQYMNDAYGKDRFKLLPAFGLDLCNLTVEFRRYAVLIDFYTTNVTEHRSQFKAQFVQDADRVAEGFYGHGDNDRKVSVTVGMLTLIQVWQGIYQENAASTLPTFDAD